MHSFLQYTVFAFGIITALTQRLFLIYTGFIAYRNIKSKIPDTRVISFYILILAIVFFIVDMSNIYPIRIRSFYTSHNVLIHFGHIIDYALPLYIFNKALFGFNKIVINILLLLSFVIYISTAAFYSFKFWQFNLSISLLFLSISILIASLMYINSYFKNIRTNRILQNPFLNYAMGLFLSNCLSFLTNFTLVLLMLSSESKSYEDIQTHLLKERSFFSYYIVNFQFSLENVSMIIFYTFLIKGLKKYNTSNKF
jgi:hypothetical protein